jgi:hypothetical protein
VQVPAGQRLHQRHGLLPRVGLRLHLRQRHLVRNGGLLQAGGERPDLRRIRRHLRDHQLGVHADRDAPVRLQLDGHLRNLSDPEKTDGVDFIALDPRSYYAQFGAFTQGFSDGIASSEYTCVNGTASPTKVLVGMDIDFTTPTTAPAYKNGKLTGSYTINDGADGSLTFKWDLSLTGCLP